MGRFDGIVTFARRKPYSNFFRVVVGLQEDNQSMESGIIYYENERRDKYEDSDEKANLDLAVVKTRRYHFDEEPFVHPLYNVRFEPDRPYELPVESLLTIKRREPSARKEPTPRVSGSSRRASPTPQYFPLDPMVRLGSPSSPLNEVSSSTDKRIRETEKPTKSWELIPSSKGWMCEGNDVEDKGKEVNKNRNLNEAEE
ncbi:hypothetical protein PIB30_012773 [Stylosanthes scabra]|uniref:Uncharacterized protein n=1 Tax=Stylosanthes scabra TaxID=79078 RepID=A0ABU6S6X9_9FABA|nr:hypothetical protein [Stylosanthes scabra]